MNVLSLSNVRSEGALLPVDILQRIVSRDKELPGMESDWHLSGGERLTDAINRSWQKMLAVWQRFSTLRDKLPQGDPAVRLTREELLLPLFAELGYGRLVAARPEDRLVRSATSETKSYPISHFWHHSPIHLVGCGVDLDKRNKGVAGAAVSPHSLVQEFLNRSDAHLWGFVSNGLVLRILRDNASFSRQSFVEFDLQGLFNGESFADFALLWMCCHQSRVEAKNPEDCWLEEWMRKGRDAAVQALDGLRSAVQEAIVALGQGFLDSFNPDLRQRLQNGDLSRQLYFRQLLRLVYRLIFLFVLEDRQVLHGPDATQASKELYYHSYSLSRLRKLALHVPGGKHHDLFEGVKLVMSRLEREGCPELGLAPLGTFLWSDEALPDLLSCRLRNGDFLKAIHALAYTTRVEWRKRPVDYRHLGARELGSVYESLLELHPVVEDGAFCLVVASGNERKTTGSYYTPTQLIDSLLESALDPVIEQTIKEARSQESAETALLNLKICDPACGSGHFLLAAAQRLAKRLGELRSGDAEPAPAQMRRALRDVISRCLYGVDINPMSVELCKISLWLEAVEPGKPLSFLDHHIQCGNSLLGTTRHCLEKGLPDAALLPLTGDDRKACTALKKRNTPLNAGLLADEWSKNFNAMLALAAPPKMDEMPANTLTDLEAQEKAYYGWIGSEDWQRKKFLFDMWCAAFVAPKFFLEKKPGIPDENHPVGITSRMIHDFAGGSEWPELRELVQNMADQYHFFHLAVAFPEVEAKGGFDVVLGNPPWEHHEIKEKEWFAVSRPDIAEAAGAQRKKKIEALQEENPALYSAFCMAKREKEAGNHFFMTSGRYPFCGRGRINLYAVFAENMRAMLNDKGRLGCIVPSGIASDDTTKFFFQNLVETKSLVSFFDFENREKIFPAIDSRIKFSLLTCGSGEQPLAEQADFVFFAHSANELKEKERRFTLSPHDIALLNPNTRTCPIFRSSKDAELTKAIYRRVPVLIREATETMPSENPWKITFRQGLFNMTTASHLFRTREQLEAEGWKLKGNVFVKPNDGRQKYLPLYEAKMVHQFNHRWATYETTDDARDTLKTELKNVSFAALPRYWVAEKEVRSKLEDINWKYGWLMGWRDICRATDERTVIGGTFSSCGVGNNLPIWLSCSKYAVYLSAVLSSYACDFAARLKVGGVHLNFFIAKQVPVLPPQMLDKLAPWQPTLTLADWLRPRILELTYTAEDMRPFAQDLGYDGAPFAWDEERRFQLRAELDAAFFHLYLPANADGSWQRVDKETEEEYKGLVAAFPTPRHAVDYIMETFPIVKAKDMKGYGCYRTKEVILKEYDGMMASLRD